jgi:hypothetical protein
MYPLIRGKSNGESVSLPHFDLNQNVKVLIENAIISLRNGHSQDALSDMTSADRLLGGSVYSGAQVIR